MWEAAEVEALRGCYDVDWFVISCQINYLTHFFERWILFSLRFCVHFRVSAHHRHWIFHELAQNKNSYWPFRTVYIFLSPSADGSNDGAFASARDTDEPRRLWTSACTLIGTVPSARRYSSRVRWLCTRNISSAVHVSVDYTRKKVKWEIRLPGKCKQRGISGDWLPWRWVVVALAKLFQRICFKNFYSVFIEKGRREKVNIGNQTGPWWREHSPRIRKAIQTVKRPAPAAVIKFRSFAVRDLYSRWKTNKSWRHRGTVDKNYFPSRFTSVIVCSHCWPPFASWRKKPERFVNQFAREWTFLQLPTCKSHSSCLEIP